MYSDKDPDNICRLSCMTNGIMDPMAISKYFFIYSFNFQKFESLVFAALDKIYNNCILSHNHKMV